MLFRITYRKNKLEIWISEKMLQFQLSVMDQELPVVFNPGTRKSGAQVVRKPSFAVDMELWELGFDLNFYGLSSSKDKLNIGLLFFKGTEEGLTIELEEGHEVGRLFYLYRKYYSRFNKLERYIDRKLAELQSSASNNSSN